MNDSSYERCGAPALVWDFSGVLTEEIGQSPDTLARFTGLEPRVWLALFATVVEADETWSSVERGQLQLHDFASRLGRAVEQAGGRMCHAYHLRYPWWGGNEPPDRSVRDQLRDFIIGTADEYDHYIATNNVREYGGYWQPIVRELPVRQIFDSSSLGYRKPEDGFFAVVEETLGWSRSDLGARALVLIDDNIANCEAAASRGWSVVHFETVQGCVAELVSLGFRLSPRQGERLDHA